jgi:DNA polymerase epsilon subunit 3
MGAGKGAKIMPPPVVPDTTSPAALQEASVLQGVGEFELPRTTLIKLAKGSVRLVNTVCDKSETTGEA